MSAVKYDCSLSNKKFVIGRHLLGEYNNNCEINSSSQQLLLSQHLILEVVMFVFILKSMISNKKYIIQNNMLAWRLS